MTFLHKNQIKSFHFSNCFFNTETMTAHLCYSFNKGAIKFEETISFENVTAPITPLKEQAIQACLRLLHLAAGVSYYKVYIPSEIQVDCTTLSEKEALFFNQFYRSGLGEFSYRNNVSPKINFPFDVNKQENQPLNYALKKRSVVPVGGGKDSIVSIEALRNTGHNITLFSVGLPKAIQNTIEKSGLESICVKRKISPELIRLNGVADEFGALNGHVPVTGIIAFILMLSAVLYDFSDAVLSNERSANVGNIEKDGMIVNHQWSKSLEFEQAFKSLTHDVLPDFRYFSLLRPLSELKIASLFAKQTTYDDVFTSCNRAFRLDETKRLDTWCCDCDKCRFVFLALAPFMPKERLIKIFGKNLLDDISQQSGFEELLGLKAFKPFECVGEIEESVWSVLFLLEKDEWKQSVVLKNVANITLEKYGKKKDCLKDKLFCLSENHLVPKDYDDVIDLFKK